MTKFDYFSIIRYYLKGPKTGQHEIFIDGLPGMPDNVKKNKGSFYFPLVITRNVLIDNISRYPTIKMIAFKLLSITERTIEILDSLYPHVYFKKSIHSVNI